MRKLRSRMAATEEVREQRTFNHGMPGAAEPQPKKKKEGNHGIHGITRKKA